MKVTKSMSTTQKATFAKEEVEELLRTALVTQYGPEWNEASFAATHETVVGYYDDKDREEFSGVEFYLSKTERS